MIRARQGHTVRVNADWEKATPPGTLYHGTVERFWPAIQAEGLKPMKRHHVHPSADPEAARRVGQRRGMPIVLIVDAAKLSDAGHEFFLTTTESGSSPTYRRPSLTRNAKRSPEGEGPQSSGP